MSGLVVFGVEGSGAEPKLEAVGSKCLVRLKPDTGQVNLLLWPFVVTL